MTRFLLVLLLASSAWAADPLRSQQWDMTTLGVDQAWSLGITGAGQQVAVIDSGVDPTHPDLNVVGGVNVTEAGGGWDNIFFHGTGVAGLIGMIQDNGRGGVGAAPGVDLWSVRITNDANGGFAYHGDISRGIQWSYDNGMSVLNVSYDVYSNTYIRFSLANAVLAGVVPVVAAGNQGSPLTDPEIPGVLVVAALDDTLTMPNWSNYGYDVICAPGWYNWTTYPDGQYSQFSGTSGAAPHVAGMAALLREEFPALTAAQITEAILGGALDLGAPGRDDIYGYGMAWWPGARAVAASIVPEPWSLVLVGSVLLWLVGLRRTKATS